MRWPPWGRYNLGTLPDLFARCEIRGSLLVGKWPIPGFVKTGDMVRVAFTRGVLMFQVLQISFPAARLCQGDELKNVGKSSEMKSLVGDGIGQRLVARKLQ